MSEHSPTARTLGARSRKEDRPLGDDQSSIRLPKKRDGTMELNLPAAEVEGTRKAHSRTSNMRCFFDPTANKPLGKIRHTKAQATDRLTDRLTSPPMRGGFAAPTAGIDPSRSNHTIRRTQRTESMHSYQCRPVKRGCECNLTRTQIPSPTNSDEG